MDILPFCSPNFLVIWYYNIILWYIFFESMVNLLTRYLWISKQTLSANPSGNWPLPSFPHYSVNIHLYLDYCEGEKKYQKYKWPSLPALQELVICHESELWVTDSGVCFHILRMEARKCFVKTHFREVSCSVIDWSLWKVWCLKWWESQPGGRLTKTTAEFLILFFVYFRVISQTFQISIYPLGWDLRDGTFNIVLSRWVSSFSISFDSVISIFKVSRYLQFGEEAWDLLSQMHHISRLEE